jgi:dolichyl-phosphate-mannose-protein mannosyltransferase
VLSQTAAEPHPRHPRTRWIAPTAVVIVAATTRLWNLGYPHLLIFDEHFYVKDAYSLTKLGYEGRWARLSDPSFVTGHFQGLTTRPELVQHPPLGKWIISLGLDAFGATSSVGWRISMAVIGILAVVLLMAIAYRLFRSFTLATIAGGLLAIDGNAIVMSRVGMLDNAVMFFALLAFGAILLDRDRTQTRLDAALPASAAQPLAGRRNPTIWARPWLIAAAALLGLDAGVKWSGFFFLAAFLVYVIGADVLARRRSRARLWLGGTLVRQGLVDVVLTLPVAIAAYLATWTGWFATSGGLYRQWANQPGNALTGPLNWVPKTLQSFWHFQEYIYRFGVSFNTPKRFATPASDWLLMTRPTQFFVGFTPNGQDGCSSTSTCVSVISDVANPLIWWASGICVFVLIVRFVFRRDWRIPAILIGVVGGYLPWLLVPRSTVFQFYTIAFEPYLILALVYVIGLVLGPPDASPHRIHVGRTTVIVFLALCLAVSVFFLPFWIGLPEPLWFEQLHLWLPGWG